MNYNDNFSYNQIPSKFTPDDGTYNKNYSGIVEGKGNPLPPALDLTIPEFNPDFDGSFNARTITEELKISAETASFRTGAFGGNANMFSQLTTSNKITPTAFTLENKDVYENLYSGVGVSRFPNVRNLATDEDRLGRAQGAGEQWFNGLTKAGQNFTKVFLQNTGGAVYGLASAVTNGEISKLYDNDFTDALDDWNTRSRYSLGNYKTEQDKQKSFFEKMGTANFWADDFAQGLSFTLGTIASELAWGAITGGGGIFAGAFAGAGKMLSGTSKLGGLGRGLGRVFTTASGRAATTAAQQTAQISAYSAKLRNFMSLSALSKIKDGSQIIRSVYTSAAMEGGMEAKQTYRDSYDSYIQGHINATGETPSLENLMKFDAAARKAGNLVFAANIPVVAVSNFAQFGALFGVNFGIGKSLGKLTGYNKLIGLQATTGLKGLATTAGKEAFAVTRFGKAVGVITPKVGTMLTEGVWEEGTQGILSTSAKEWLKSRYNVDRTSDNLSIMDAMYKGMEHQYGTKEGREEMYIGMLIGAFGNNISQAMEKRSAAPLVTGFFRSGNAEQRASNIKAWDTLKTEYDNVARNSVEDNFAKVFNTALNNVLIKNQQDSNLADAQTALAEGDLVKANMHKMNAEFANYYRVFERLEDFTDFSFEELTARQVDEMDEASIAKEHGVSIEEAKQAKEEYKTSLLNQVEDYRKADRVAKATLNLMGDVGKQASPLRMYLTNQLYNAQGLDKTMDEMATQIGNLWNTNDSFFASKMRLVLNLRVSNEVDLANQQAAEAELKEAEKELIRLNNELPGLSDGKLDAEGNVVTVNQKQIQMEKIMLLSAKIEDLKRDVEAKTERLNKLESVAGKTKFGGLFEGKQAIQLTRQDITDTLKALEELDTYKTELLNDKKSKKQGIYLHNLLESYGRGLMTMQNISTLYDELANKDNKNLASFVLRLRGGNHVEDFNETKEEKERLDNIINAIQEKFLKGKAIGDKTEARAVIRAFLRAGENNKRFDREKNLVRVYDYEKKEFKNSEAYLTDVRETVGNDVWEAYSNNNLDIGDDVSAQGDIVVNEIVRKIVNKLPLSNREQIIYDENKNHLDKAVRILKKQPNGQVETYENVLEDIKERKRNSKMPTREEFNEEKENSQKTEKEYLEDKIARKLANLINFFKTGLNVSKALETVQNFSETDIAEYLELKKNGVANEEDARRFDELEERLKIISEFQGTTTEDNSTLLDDINQLAQILKFMGQGTVKQVNEAELEDVADTEVEFTKTFRNSTGGDLSIAQNYSKAFVTRQDTPDESLIRIANISPHMFASLAGAVVVNEQNQIVEIRNLEDKQFINERYKMVLPNGEIIPFFINENGNLVFNDSNGDFNRLKEGTTYLFEAVSSFTKGQPLLFVDGNGDVLYVDSDFVNVDEVTTTTGRGASKQATTETFANVIDQEAIKELKQGEELIVVYPANNTYTKGLKNGIEVVKEGLLMLYTKSGKFVGVLKRYNGDGDATNKNSYYNLRKQAIEGGKKSTTFINEKQGLRDSGIRVSVEMVWHGHPNLEMTVNENGEVEVKSFDFNENSVKEVVDIGFVENKQITTKNGTELNVAGQYYMTASIKKNPNTKIPFVVIKLNGRNVMYPVSLKVLESSPLTSFEEIMNNPSLSVGDKVLALNELLNQYNIPYTSFFFNNANVSDQAFVEDVKATLSNADLYGEISKWTDDRSIGETLTEEAEINVDLANNPFHSPKIKFEIPTYEVKKKTVKEEEKPQEEEEEEEEGELEKDEKAELLKEIADLEEQLAKLEKSKSKTKAHEKKKTDLKLKIAQLRVGLKKFEKAPPKKKRPSTKASNIEDAFLKAKKAIEDQMDLLPNRGVSIIDGKIILSPEYESLKATLDDIVDRYEKAIRNRENKNRGGKNAIDDAEKEVDRNC